MLGQNIHVFYISEYSALTLFTTRDIVTQSFAATIADTQAIRSIVHDAGATFPRWSP